MRNARNAKRSYLDAVEQIVSIAKEKVVQMVNVSTVYTYYAVGQEIVEEEQRGQGRAGYGERILQNVSKRLTDRFGRGWSAENLRLMRKLFLVYSQEFQNAVLEIPDEENPPNRRIFASKYLTVLPDKESLRLLVRKHLGEE